MSNKYSQGGCAISRRIEQGLTEIPFMVDDREILTLLEVSNRQRQSLLAGGMLNLVRRELGS